MRLPTRSIPYGKQKIDIFDANVKDDILNEINSRIIYNLELGFNKFWILTKDIKQSKFSDIIKGRLYA